MMSFTKQAIAIAEGFARNCSEIQILHAHGSLESNNLKPQPGYTSVLKLYSGDADKITLLVEQELFEHFNKSITLKSKLKNTYQPWVSSLDAEHVTIYIVGK